MLTIVIEKGILKSVSRDGTPLYKEFWGLPYEHALNSENKELVEAIRKYEGDNPFERAKRQLRKYKEGTTPVIERCPHCMRS